MKITIEFGNGPALALAPESLSLTQLNAEQIALVGTVGTYAIPIVSFPGSLATADEVAARTAPKSVAVESEFTPDADLCLAPTAGYSCSLNAGHCGDFHAAYEDHDIQHGALIGRSPVAPKSYAEEIAARKIIAVPVLDRHIEKCSRHIDTNCSAHCAGRKNKTVADGRAETDTEVN